MPEIGVQFSPPPDRFLPPPAAVDAWHNEFDPAMHSAVHLVRGNIVEVTPHAFGHLRNSMHGNVTAAALAIRGRVVTSSPYGAPVNFGSKPHWPPIGPLELWVKRKLGGAGGAISERAIGEARGLRRAGFRGVRKSDVQRGIESDIARRIQYKIAKHGTKGHHMFEKGWNASISHVQIIFDAAFGRFLNRLKNL